MHRLRGAVLFQPPNEAYNKCRISNGNQCVGGKEKGVSRPDSLVLTFSDRSYGVRPTAKIAKIALSKVDARTDVKTHPMIIP